ncbi:GNAT family N-acetyltransferase [Paenibacillus sp. CFBP13512]|nr:GNAT family N-acetyltransferase [Paenibacillus sp. CFBP13512]TKJ86266.1 GNAT family N-acetyltransferase [Paenibacillus sp. CFBP13512]
MPTVIRQATSTDVDALTTIMNEYIGDFYQKPKPAVEKLHHLIHTLLELQLGVQFVVKQNNQTVGFATLYFSFSSIKAEKVTIMNDLYLQEHLRDTEVEVQLFKHCHKYTQDHGFAHMSWVAAPHNTRAHRFFDQMGCTRIDWVDYMIV